MIKVTAEHLALIDQLQTNLNQSWGEAALYRVFYIAIGLMLVGNAGMLLLTISAPIWLLAVPMILLGFSFGIPLGLIDRSAMDAVPAASSGSASGLLQFARLGSEAIIIGSYALVISTLIAERINRPKLAEDVASGLPGHASDYIPAFATTQYFILSAIAIGLVVIAVLHRASRRSATR